MGKKSSPPPQADPNIGLAAQSNMELAKVQREIADRQLDLQRQQMDTANQQYADQRKQIDEAIGIYRDNISKQNEMTDLTMEQARKARDDYERLYRPNEERMVEDANAAGSEDMQEQEAGRAGIDTQRQLDMQREINARSMESMGVNPNSGKFQALGRADMIRGAAARAGAETGARMQEQARGEALRANVANFGRGIASAATGAAGQAGGMAAGTGASGGFGFGLNAANNAAMMGAYGQGMGGLGAAGGSISAAGSLNNSAANILGNQYQNQLSAWNARQQQRGGMFGGLGSMVGSIGSSVLTSSGGIPGLFALSDENVKYDKQKVTPEEMVAAIKSRRIERWKYKHNDEEHIGTYAQDAEKAMGKVVNIGGVKTIDLITEMGVTQGALKAVIEKVEQLERAA